MPVKVRCQGCGKVLTAPDRARGKAIRCPGCQQAIRVPAAAAVAKQPAARAAGDDERFLQNLDISRVQSRNERVCPKCAAEVEAEDVECPKCGVNLETGLLSDEQRRIRQRVGPDPALFYRKVWANSWAFLKVNKKLAFRTAMYWTSFVITALVFANRAMGAINREGVSETGKYVEAGIWGMVAVFSLASVIGWYWYIAVKITQVTLDRGTKLKDLHFDFHKFMALGVKGVLWPFVLMTPVIVVAVPILGIMAVTSTIAFDGTGLSVIGMVFGAIALFPYLAFPIAMSHMAMPYTYKASLPVDMVVLFFRNIGAVLYWWLMAFIVTLPITAYLFTLNFFADKIVEFVPATLQTWALWCELVRHCAQAGGILYGMFKYILIGIFGFLAICSITIPAAFPAVSLARANALFTYYRRETLDLMTHSRQGEIAGFWVRYLAALIDFVVLMAIFGVYWGIFGLAFALLIVRFGAVMMLPGLLGITGLLTWFTQYRYYVKSETGNSQGTFGKTALGLIVTNMDGTKISIKTARNRYTVRTFLTPLLPFYGGYLMAAFTEKKQALHDSLSKTIVVWEGDRER